MDPPANPWSSFNAPPPSYSTFPNDDAGLRNERTPLNPQRIQRFRKYSFSALKGLIVLLFLIGLTWHFVNDYSSIRHRDIQERIRHREDLERLKRIEFEDTQRKLAHEREDEERRESFEEEDRRRMEAREKRESEIARDEAQRKLAHEREDEERRQSFEEEDRRRKEAREKREKEIARDEARRELAHKEEDEERRRSFEEEDRRRKLAHEEEDYKRRKAIELEETRRKLAHMTEDEQRRLAHEKDDKRRRQMHEEEDQRWKLKKEREEERIKAREILVLRREETIQAKEDAMRDDEERRKRAGLAWQDLTPEKRCLGYEKRMYQAKLINIPYEEDAQSWCMKMAIDIHGITYDHPDFCTQERHYGTVSIIGHWTVTSNEPTCKTWWGNHEKKGCHGSHKMRVEARMFNHQEPWDNWAEMCYSTPSQFAWQSFAHPDTCENKGKNDITGSWFINVDESECP